MFERTIEETIAFFRRETIADAAVISSRSILDADIPVALKRMFEADLDAIVTEEKRRLADSPRFRYDDDEVLALLDRIGEKARDRVLFTAEEFAEALERNVKLLFNYVCRPQWTLVKYLFADRENAATDDIVDALRVFWHYEYFPIILREYFEQKSLTVINIRKFTDLVERVDHEVVRNFDSRRTAHLAEPLFDLFNIGVSPEEATAPVEALSMFFDDKNLSAIVERLDQERAMRERITMHDLVMLIGEADYTIGLDISSIINEQLNMGGMKKEREATAAQDFDIPQMPEYDGDGVHHGDLGHEDDSLDFVISEEEQGVVMQDHDHATRPLEDDLNDDIEVHDLLIEDDQDIPDTADNASMEEEEEGSIYPFTTDAPMSDPEEEASTIDEEDFHGNTSIDDSILEIEKSMTAVDLASDDLESTLHAWNARNSEEESADVEREASPPENVDNDVPDVRLVDENDQPTQQFLESKDIIPDFTLDEFDSPGVEGYGEEEDPYAIDETSPMLSTTLEDDDLEEATPITDSNVSLTEDEIDWEKEAEDMEDIDIDGVEEEEQRLSEAIPQGADILRPEEELPGAEELLSQLDLDEMDEPEPVKKKAGNYDIPVVEDPLPPVSRQADNETPAAPEEEVPAEEVIREFGDLNQLLPDGDKKKYAKKLFGKDDEAFARAIQVLNGKPSWRKASEYIDELFIKFDVDMYSRLAVKFTDDIYKRYANKK